MSTSIPPTTLPWKPCPEAGENAFRLDQINFDSRKIVTASVARTPQNRWAWAVFLGERLIHEGEHHRPGRAFSDAAMTWAITCIAVERRAA